MESLASLDEARKAKEAEEEDDSIIESITITERANGRWHMSYQSWALALRGWFLGFLTVWA